MPSRSVTTEIGMPIRRMRRGWAGGSVGADGALTDLLLAENDEAIDSVTAKRQPLHARGAVCPLNIVRFRPRLRDDGNLPGRWRAAMLSVEPPRATRQIRVQTHF